MLKFCYLRNKKFRKKKYHENSYFCRGSIIFMWYFSTKFLREDVKNVKVLLFKK